MHNCSNLIPNCRNISQTNSRGAYTIIFNNGNEKVFPSFNHLVQYILHKYMTNNYVPYTRQAYHENRIITTLLENGIVAAARGIKTKKNKRKRGTKKRRGKK